MFWANDVVIDMYFGNYTMLGTLDKFLSQDNPNKQRSLFLHRNSDNWLRLRSRSVTERYKEQLNSIGFFDIDKIFLPVYYESHWTLYVIFIKQRQIVYYDSLNMPYPPSILPQCLLNYIEDEANDALMSFNIIDWKIIRANVVQQGNEFDCAFHIIKNALLVMHDLPLDLQVRKTKCVECVATI